MKYPFYLIYVDHTIIIVGLHNVYQYTVEAYIANNMDPEGAD